MKNVLRFAFVLMMLDAMAQREQSHWFMGTYLGMKFTNATMSVIPVKTSAAYAPYASATYSDPATGSLLFYTNGSYVYNRQHQQMPNGFYINNETYGIHSVIVPHPGNSFLYYIITSASTEHKLYYAQVDMRLQGGLGDVTQKIQLLDDNSDLPFCVVKQLYHEGFWIITHTFNSTEFKSFRIGKNGLDLNPVLSNAGTQSPVEARYTYGKMVSNSSGDRFVFTHGWVGLTGVCEEFWFDKKCGKVSFKQSISAHPLQGVEQFAYPAYSADNSKLYVSWTYSTGQSLLLQYNLNDQFPNSSYTILNQTSLFSGDLQLAPDGKIYVASVENGAVTAKISVIENPNTVGIGCNFRDKKIALATNSNLYFTEHFPEFVMDQSTPVKGYTKPVLIIDNQCLGNPTNLSVQPDFTADSVIWDLGDGTRVGSVLKLQHLYNQSGIFPVEFSWYVCGYRYVATDTVKIGTKPVFSLGKDTTLCAGAQYYLRSPVQGTSYLWSTRDTGIGITVGSPGTYWLEVSNGKCATKDEIRIGYYPSLFTALGEEYFICNDDRELVKLDAGEKFIQYKWTPTGDTSQWIIVGDVGDYFVVVKDYRGCSGQDGTKVQRRCPVTVYFPNAFTPNNDGLNDTYAPSGKDIESFSMKIFNRWGQLVFETSDINYQWNGKVKSEYAPIDTYFYTATYSGYLNKRLKEFSEKGSFLLVR